MIPLRMGFTAAGGTEYELVAVGDDSLAHGQVTDVQMKRYAALPVRHTDTERAGRTAVIRFRSKQADSLFQKGIETFLSRKIARIAWNTRPVQHRSIYRVVSCCNGVRIPSGQAGCRYRS